MPIELKMPALSPTMEEGTLAKWLVKEGDTVKSGDLLAEIETDKATMEFEAIDEGVVSQILVAEGTDNVKVGTVIAVIAGEGEDAGSAKAAPAPAAEAEPKAEAPTPAKDVAPAKAGAAPISAPTPAVPASAGTTEKGDRIKASPLAKRLAAEQGIDLKTLTGTGPGGRIVKADLEGAPAGAAAP
ncbi:biotin/lipoyl-containing protein, partial [Sphingopyxis sp.]|uniref:biotin/lipoyl-containing protein n=1 Tax=Sphingopyxis sp. TaxID=1908224 RepID=UPI002B47FC3C